MKTPRPRTKAGSINLVEVLVILAVGLLLAVLALALLARSLARAQRINCVNNLKQVGLAFRIDARDYQDKAPIKFSALDNFLGLTNELGAPKLVTCPTDIRPPVTQWNNLASSNLSYFIGLAVDETNPQMLRAGDRNITNSRPVLNGLLTIATNESPGWTHEMHQGAGNLLHADGGVQQVTQGKLREAVRRSGTRNGLLRLAIPE